MDPEEAALILKSQNGDEEAFAELVRRYRRRIFSLCIQILGDQELAEDVVQETFINAFRHLDSFKMQSRIYTWLYRIAVNLSINALKKRKSQSVKIVGDMFNFAETLYPVQESQSLGREDLEHHEIIEIIDKGLQTLPESQREVLQLFDIEGLTHKEVAERLHVNVGTVRSRLHYARKKMRLYLEERL